jgi:hypothetical protein
MANAGRGCCPYAFTLFRFERRGHGACKRLVLSQAALSGSRSSRTNLRVDREVQMTCGSRVG